MPVPAGDAPFERDLLKDQAYVAIRDAIVDGTLAPEERLRDQELCAWLGLSRTPVREALSRLEQDGLVETAPQRFTRVAPLDRRAARDAFPVVAALHALAAELAIGKAVAASTQGGADVTGGAGGAAGVAHIAEADRAAMRAANEAFARALQANDVDAALAADDAFHGVFVTASTNGEIRRALDRLMPRIRRLERMRFGSLQGRASVKQHAEILMAEPHRVPDLVKQNWLSLGALIDRSFE